MLTSPPPTPQRASVPHKLLAHLSSNVSDFDTGGRVTSSTRLQTLYLLKDQEVNNDRLRNATGKTMPRVPAQMLIKADGQWTAYPPSRDADYGYQVSMRFNTLYSAPTVRIEIEFSHDGQADTPRLPTLVLEYPFNDRDGRQLSNFACELIDGESDDSESDDGKQHNDEQALTIVRFEANGATSEGCVTIDSFASPLTAEQESVFEMLRIQRTTGRTFTIAIAIEAQEASDNTSPTLKLLSKLAGSGGSLLPSLRHREWDDFLPEGWQNMDAKEFLSARPTRPNLMLMQKCGTTFSSVEHFCATHLVAELIANEEGSGELRLWARADHDIALFELKGHVVLAMKFGNPIVLSSGRKVLRHPKIPNDLEIRIKLSDGGRELVWITACHERDLMGLNRHFKFDAYFKVTSHTPADFPGPFHKPNDPRPKIWRAVSLIPHENRFWVESVLHTASTLYYDARWHPFMLGQGLDSVKTVDVIATVEVKDDVKASAWQWLLKAKQWNFQQRRVIDSLHQALDGIVLCTGFPGTGKTPLLLASAVYFVKLGGRAIISAAENGHVESMASNLDLIIGDATRPDGEPIIAYIVQSSSRGKRLLETSGQQAPFNKKGHQDGSAGGLDNFIFSLLLGEEQRDKAFQYTLCNAVAVEAEKGELNLPIRLPDQNGIDYGQPINAWQRLLELMVQIREGIFPHHSKMARSELQKIFSACEKQLIKRADIMVTTACNAKCKELCYWGKYMRESGVSISTFGVFIDNADSCRAMELWNVITSCASRPDIVMIAGDVRVLGPINTSINQIPVCNPFAASLSMSDFERLIKLDLPVTTLTEQGFMVSFYNQEH
ncbi:hypothetical protein CB0940_04157 [Cercospora beticola]|uniref:DNA2/NAM7 helicase helicase domain-containing protein n=1 Tax=Cercospora beticola TaxID=122368 RepID=A0A2G5HKD5_CERBT|nr:hypothetical protein CB0940_04157 [Cercospora beticola]PIA92999.1 hypothetical protein CB0940_04157 [Cercospora beticola]WPB01373.1 hypothetical protein RHO25_005999 [Cercospora beticola]